MFNIGIYTKRENFIGFIGCANGMPLVCSHMYVYRYLAQQHLVFIWLEAT